MEKITLPYVANRYYETPGTREICHALKEKKGMDGYNDAINEVTKYLNGLHIVKKGDYLVPVPQHTGKAEYTLDIAEKLAFLTEATVLDVVGRTPSETWYSVKKKGSSYVKPCFFLKNDNIPTDKKLFFLDNVISTGMTYRKVSELFQKELIPLVYAVG